MHIRTLVSVSSMHTYGKSAVLPRDRHAYRFISPLLLSSLKFRNTQFSETQIRALLGTASHFCEVAVITAAMNTYGQTAVLQRGRHA